MKARQAFATLLAILSFASVSALAQDRQAPGCNRVWRIHDMERPRPPVVDPGTAGMTIQPAKPPSDAVVLFDGKDLSQWQSVKGGPARWKVEDGAMVVVRGAGDIRSLRAFGDCQIHIEWATPNPPKGSGQGRGNSGVYVMGLYEVQVLDSYKNDTYPDGQAAAIYGQYPPLVNACRPPGEWQSYDIIFHRPRFGRDGELLKPARITVLQNGVLVQDNVTIKGPTDWMHVRPYRKHLDKLPLVLQDHGNPVRYRNIWVRELPDPDQPWCGLRPEIYLGPEVLKRYAGWYGNLLVLLQDDHLAARLSKSVVTPIFPENRRLFFSKTVGVELEFKLND
ncbi:MAG: DUF1080 domain-containing protein, partial [Calditrichaeota bacterium]|nr:DUF1080 domain-containing protein [Calditrichota bacterium]